MLLKNASNTELYQTILAIYDTQIDTAKDRYVSQMLDNMLNGNDPDAEYPDIDLTKVTNQLKKRILLDYVNVIYKMIFFIIRITFPTY